MTTYFETADMSSKPEVLAPRSTLRLLLVEDNAGDARLLSLYLSEAENLAFELEHVVRLGDAREKLAQEAYNLILLDLSLPDSQGLESLTGLGPHVATCPVIVLTGLNDEAMAIEAVRQGAQDYLVKSQIESQLLARSVAYAIERFRVLEALRESEERYALAARAANDGLWDWDLISDRIYYSPRWCLMLGHQEEELSDSPEEWFSRLHPEDRGPTRQALQDHLNGLTAQFEHEYRICHADGRYRWMLSRGLALYNAEDEPYRLAGSQTDITARKRTEDQLIHDAHHDPLTQLPNRVLFRERLEQALYRTQATPGSHFAILFLDLDRFKTINDSLGHLTGDELLQSIATRLEETLSPGDTIARLGGDEFAVLVENLEEPDDAIQVAIRLLDAFRRPFHIGNHEIFSSSSVGIALNNGHYRRPEEMLRDADTAMYRAKAAGPAQYRLFDSTMHTKVVALWRLETDLRRAVERGEFRIHYQPIVSLESGKLAGFEALVRWQHPERGLLYPGDFLAVAEETGLIASLDRWTIRQGALQMKRWHDRYTGHRNLFLCVNLSGGILNEPGLPEYIENVLGESNLPSNSLRLEITESVVMNDIFNVPRTLARLQELEIQLCIDDFGTGYSSLSSLHYYPVDTLKIAQSFISEIDEGSHSEIVRTIITLAHDLDLDVIGEGIETERQYLHLKSLSCEYGQGSYFSTPIAVDECQKILEKNPSW